MLESTSTPLLSQGYETRRLSLRGGLEEGSQLESFPPPLVSKPSFTMSIGDDYTDDSQGHGASESSDSPAVDVAQQSVRWLILMLSCFLLFGNYFAYDNPAALNTQLQKHLEMPYDEYQYLLSALYSIYSLPNTVLPFVFGHLVDRFGAHHMLLFLSGCVCVGQALFALGVQHRSVGMMLVGRGIFGIGGESCGVAQASITTRYFRGHELAFALGLNLCISRFGSVVNTLVTPWVEQRWNVTIAVWLGTLSCVLSFISAFILVNLMIKVEPHKYRALEQTFTTSRSSSVAETLQADSSTAVSDDETDLCRAPLENPPMSPHPSVHSVVFTPGRPKLGREPSLHVFTDQTFMEAPPATAIATWQEAWWDGILSFPMTFWILCLLTVLLYGTVVPFNNIASDFLQSKWFPGRPRKATAVMGIPDTIGSILVPIFGLLVDRHGGRATILIMSAVIMVTVHSTLGFTMLNPIFAFMLLGVAYSMYGVALWPSIACVVKDEVHLGMGYGISSSFLNISLTIVPPVVATIRIIGGSFLPVEMFFISMGLAGIVAGLVLKSIDARQGGALEAPEIEVDVPVIVPPPGTSPAVITSQDGMIVNPLLSPQIKYHPTMNLGHTFLDHSPSPLGIYQHDRYGDGSADDMLQQDLVNKGYDDRCNDSGNGTSSEETAPLVEPTMSPNEGYRRSESRDRRAFTLPWNHYRVQKPSPSLLQGLRRTAPNRARSSTTRSLTADGSDSINSPHLLQPDHRQEEQQQQRRQNQSAPSLSSSTAVSSSSSRPRFYGSFSTPSIVSFGRGAVEIMVDDEATLHEPTTATTLFRPLPPRHQYSVRQHPILHNPLRGSSGSFRIHRNARRIRFGEGEEGNLFLNGLPVAHPNDLQSALLEDSGHGGSASGAGGDVAPARVLFHGVGIDGGAGSSEGDKDDDPDGQNGRQS